MEIQPRTSVKNFPHFGNLVSRYQKQLLVACGILHVRPQVVDRRLHICLLRMLDLRNVASIII
jgi:hypothetical protein